MFIDMSKAFVADIPLVAADAISCRPVEGDLAERVHPIIKLLGDYNRLKIFSLLTQGERCVCDIEAEMGLAQNLVSHHLRILKEANLITARRDGRWTYYAISTSELDKVYPVICALFNPACIGENKTAC